MGVNADTFDCILGSFSNPIRRDDIDIAALGCLLWQVPLNLCCMTSIPQSLISLQHIFALVPMQQAEIVKCKYHVAGRSVKPPGAVQNYGLQFREYRTLGRIERERGKMAGKLCTDVRDYGG